MLDIRDVLGFSIFGMQAPLFATPPFPWRFENVMFERTEWDELLTAPLR